MKVFKENQVNILLLKAGEKNPLNMYDDEALEAIPFEVRKVSGTQWLACSTKDYMQYKDAAIENEWCNFGMTLYGKCVVDFDPRNTDDLAELKSYAQKIRGEGDVSIQTTGGGGRHFIYTSPRSTEYSAYMRKTKLRPDTDFLTGSRCYIVIAPSVTTSAYEVVQGTLSQPPEMGTHTADMIKKTVLERGIAEAGDSSLPAELNGLLMGNKPSDDFTLASLSKMLAVASADCSYEEWRSIMFGITHQFAHGEEEEEAKEIALQWSMTAPFRFEAAAFNVMWESGKERSTNWATVGGNLITIRSLVHQYNETTKAAPPEQRKLSDFVDDHEHKHKTPYERVFRSLEDLTTTQIAEFEAVEDNFRMDADGQNQVVPSPRTLMELCRMTGFGFFTSTMDASRGYSAIRLGVGQSIADYGDEAFVTTPLEDVNIQVFGTHLYAALQHYGLDTGYKSSKAFTGAFTLYIRDYLARGKEDGDGCDSTNEITSGGCHIQAIIDDPEEWDGIDRMPLFRDILNPDYSTYGLTGDAMSAYDEIIFGEGGVFTNLLVGYATRTMGIDNREGQFYLPILMGKGGCGKSGFVNALGKGMRDMGDGIRREPIVTGDRMRRKYRTSNTVIPSLLLSQSESDFEPIFAKGGIQELAEVTGFINSIASSKSSDFAKIKGAARLEPLKSMITAGANQLGGKYLMVREVVNHTCLIGTANPSDSDDGNIGNLMKVLQGTRRLIIVPTGRVDFELLEANWLQIWKQAIAYARMGKFANYTPDQLEQRLEALKPIAAKVAKSDLSLEEYMHCTLASGVTDGRYKPDDMLDGQRVEKVYITTISQRENVTGNLKGWHNVLIEQGEGVILQPDLNKLNKKQIAAILRRYLDREGIAVKSVWYTLGTPKQMKAKACVYMTGDALDRLINDDSLIEGTHYNFGVEAD